MAGSVDVKALRDRLHASAQMAHSSRGDTGPARYPLPGFGKEVLMRPGHAGVSQNGVARHKLPPMVPSPFPSGGLSPSPRFSGPLRTEPGSAGPRPPPPVGVFPRPPAPGGLVRAAPPQPAPGGLVRAAPPQPAPGGPVRAAPPQPADSGRVRPSGELLQNIMLRHQRPPPSSSSSSSSSTTQAPPKPLTTVRPLPASQRSQVEVPPLRKPLPPEGPRPPKPRRPPRVNLEGWTLRGPPPPLPPSPVRSARLKNNDGSLSSGGSNLSLPGLVSPVGPPRPPYKPSSLPRQRTSIQCDDDQDTYDDIDTLERNDTWTDSSSQHLTGGSDDDSEVYELIDEHQLELKKGFSEEKKIEVKPQQQQQQQEDKRQQKERQKRESELRKKFQIKGEVEVLYVAQVRQDWNGGAKLDLNVQQGDRVEILRVKNNPGGRWLARTLSGNYGYISNACVDVDYEEVKRKVRQAQGLDASPLPPPPPDPRLPPPPPDPRLPPPPPDPPLTDDIYYDVESGDHMDSSSWAQENVVMPVDFPPPPHEVRMDPKVERDLRKRFKYEGPLTVLHTMMVDPNGIIKKPGAKDLAVAQGEILDIIQLTNDKKALCRNQYRRYGYVSRALLLPMEGDDIYDDVDTFNDDSDIYDNDNMH